ncbi:hypothetical protein Tco_1018255 [Tanacetum coccineum]|uniref:Uncharacterized protein n=1 Tax=Tanacetum coccineum TaxID=301880 RepID=A0ABQ5FU07_9ASTR
MRDEHLSTIPETESDELVKSNVENLVPILSKSEDFSDIESECDVPVCDDFTTSSNPLFDEHLDTIPATKSDEVIKSSVENLVQIPSESEDDILREKLLNVNLHIAKIEAALKDNPSSSSDFVTKASSTSLNFFLEETNTFDNSLPESETFCFNLEEISSGSPTSY